MDAGVCLGQSWHSAWLAADDCRAEAEAGLPASLLSWLRRRRVHVQSWKASTAVIHFSHQALAARPGPREKVLGFKSHLMAIKDKLKSFWFGGPRWCMWLKRVVFVVIAWPLV